MMYERHVLFLYIKILGGALLFISLYIGLFSSFFTWNTIRVSGLTQARSRTLETEAMASSLFSSRSILSHNHFLLLNERGAREFIIAHVPEFASYTLDRNILDRSIDLHITVYKPVFKMEDGRVISEEGEIFTTAEDVSSLPVIHSSSSTLVQVPSLYQADQSTFVLPDGMDATQTAHTGFQDSSPLTTSASTTEYLRDPTVISHISKILALISEISGEVKEVQIDKNGVIEYSLPQGLRIRTHAHQSPESVFSALSSAALMPMIKSALRESGTDVRTLDVRFLGKVFYTLSSDVVATATSTVSTGTPPH